MTRLPIAALLALLAACSSSPPGGGTCSWPADLNPTDAGPGRCTAKRYRLQCESSSGVGQLCLSNDPNHCEADFAPPGATCHDQCGPNEYGVVCGRVGPSGVSSDPPSPNCHTPGFTPAGTAFYCCPCGP
jgi:hypothetical protein